MQRRHAIRLMLIAACLAASWHGFAGQPAEQAPRAWAEAIPDRPGLPNLFRVGPGLYRGAQPEREGYADRAIAKQQRL